MRVVKINFLLKEVILKIIDYIFPPKQPKSKGRPPKYSNEVYLDNIFYVLKEGIGWNYIKEINISGDTLRKVFQKWTNKNVFEIAYNIIIDIYKDRKIDFTDLFIDASNIKNYMGSELTGVNHCDKFKLATKLSIITDDLGVPVSIHLEKCNVHDIKLVVPNLEKIKIDTESAENLIADKGYISKTLKQYISEKYKMRIITPEKNPKKGVKKKSSENDKIKLRKRYIVEHTFSWIKNYTRLFRRKDKKISMYVSFMFFGICNITANKMEKYIIK